MGLMGGDGEGLVRIALRVRIGVCPSMRPLRFEPRFEMVFEVEGFDAEGVAEEVVVSEFGFVVLE